MLMVTTDEAYDLAINQGFALIDSPIDEGRLKKALHAKTCGALATFEGWVRDHNEGRGVEGLHYEAYTVLAEAEGGRVLQEARGRFAIVDACCVHRVGELGIGELAVWVGVTAAHRDEAFAACRYIIDEVKSRVPIWKHERYREGDAGWLHPSEGPASS